MTEILLEWLNNEVNLSKKITNISEDFSNGFLFGEILHRFHQIPNFSEYKNSNEPNDLLHTFGLLEKALRDLDIRLDDVRTQEIIHKKKGVAAIFLFKIKNKLSRKLINLETLKPKKEVYLHQMYKSLIFPSKNERYIIDATNRKTNPENVLRNSCLPQKFQKLKLTPYNIDVIKELAKDEEKMKKENEKILKTIHEKEGIRHSDQVATEKKEVDLWNKSIDDGRKFNLKLDDERMKNSLFYRNSVIESLKYSSHENEAQIDLFDKNLARLGLDLDTIDIKLKKQNKVMSSEMIMQKMKEKIEMKAAAKKERDRRKRKIRVEQNRIFEGQENRDNGDGNKGSEVTMLLSSQEKRLEYEAVKILHNRNVSQEESKNKSSELVKSETSETTIKKEKEEESEISTKFQPEIFFEMLDKEDLQLRQKEMKKRYSRKERDYPLILKIMNLILGITEECYKFQQENSTELIDVKEWNYLTEMFINNPIAKNEMAFIENENENGNGKRTAINHDETMIDRTSRPLSENTEVAHLIEISDYEDNEFLDYLSFLGHWKKTLIPESVKETQLQFADVLGTDFVVTVNGNKISPFARTSKNNIQDIYEPKDDDIENITIPKNTIKNPTLNEIIEIVLDLKFPQESFTNPNLPFYYYLPLKLSFIGHKFAGKKTQAKLISEQYPGIKIFNIEDLLKKSLETFEKLETPIEAHPKFKTLKKPQIDQLMKEKAAEEEAFKDIKTIIQSYAKTVMNNKQDPPQPDDEMLVDLLIFFLKADFPEKSYLTYVEEAQQRNKRKREIAEELTKLKEDQPKKTKAKPKEEQQLVNELSKLSSEVFKGFIIIDFPRNEEQARLFEYKLAGYIQEIEIPYNQKTFTKEKFCEIVDKTLRNAPQKVYANSPLDLIVNIDVPSTECIRRLVGRRIDPNNGNIYHLEDNPPPENEKRLLERLQVIPEPSEEKLRQKNIESDFSVQKIIDFFDPQNIPKINQKRFVNMNGMMPKSSLFSEIQNSVVQKLIKIHEEKENELCGNITENNITTQNELLYQVVAFPDDDDFNNYNRKLNECKKKIPPTAYESIYTGWARLYQVYSSECKMTLNTFKVQRESLATNMNIVQSKFIEFLSRQSKKRNVIAEYVNKYNSFAEKYPELKEHPKVKTEFHNDVTELNDRLWAIIDARKNEAIEERKIIMHSGWIDNEMQKCYTALEKLFLLETDKFLTSMAIILEFYLFLDNKANLSLSDLNVRNVFLKPNEILSDVLNFDLEEYDTAGHSRFSFPRIERLYKHCFKLIFKQDEQIRQFENSIKSASAHNSSHDSSSLKKKKTYFQYSLKSNESLLQDDKKEIFLYEEELKTALKNEKIKYKYRVTLLKFWGIKSLSEMRKLASCLYESLDEWIISSVKAQNDALNALTDHFRALIERGYKMKYEHELDTFDIYQAIHAKSFFEDECNPEMESRKYNYQTFLHMYQEIKSREVQKNYVKLQTFFEIYVKQYLIELSSNAIPPSIQKLSFHNFRKFAKYFILKDTPGRKTIIPYDQLKDFNMIEFINIKHLATILAVVHCEVLDELNEGLIKEQGNGLLRNSTLIAKEQFMNLKLWFESNTTFILENDDQQSATRLKEMIYEINKDDNNELNIIELLDVLSLRIIPTFAKNISRKSYYDLLLAS